MFAAPPPGRLVEPRSMGAELAQATLLAAVAVALCALAERAFGFRDLSLVFITAVLLVATRSRLPVSIYMAVLCFLAYNFFFIHPRYTFYIATGEGAATVFLFLVAALLCGRLAGRLRAQVLLLRAANARTEALQSLGARLATSADSAAVARETIDALGASLGARAVVLAVTGASGRLQDVLAAADGLEADAGVRRAAQACLDGAPANEPGRPFRLDAEWWCLPLFAGGAGLGAACLRFDDRRTSLSAAQASLAQAMARIAAEALGRTQFAAELEGARLRAETERLRAALLTSVSHDLRSPLSTIIGSAESLTLFGDTLSRADQGILAADILGEGLRLDRYIQNLLDMTRLGQAPSAPAEWVGVDELLGGILPRLRQAHPTRRVDLDLGARPPLLHGHAALLGQALFNLLENAAKFSPAGAPVLVVARTEDAACLVEVSDSGRGIAPADRDRVFDMFHSAGREDGEGTGLGLTIARGIAALHGGTLEALAGPGGVGTTMRLRVPVPSAAGAPRIVAG